MSKASRRYILNEWNPENPKFWRSKGRRKANRNLWLSISTLLLAFVAIWQVLFGCRGTASPGRVPLHAPTQLFWLAAMPGLSGATLRIFYSFMVPVFGGRRWAQAGRYRILKNLILCDACPGLAVRFRWE